MKYRYIRVFTVFQLALFQGHGLLAQTFKNPGSYSLGFAGLTIQDQWMLWNNPAGMACENQVSGGIAIDKSYLLKEFNKNIFTSVIPAGKYGVAGLGFSQFGYTLYNKQQVLIGWSKNFSDKFFLGTAMTFEHLHLGDGYGDRTFFKIKFGFQAKLTEVISIAALIDNPQRDKLSDYNNERSPSIFSIGLSNKFSNKLKLYLDGECVTSNQIKLCSGLEYHPYQQVFLRGGISTRPLSGTFGFGFVKGNVQIDLGVSRHPELGFSPVISVSYKKNKYEAEK